MAEQSTTLTWLTATKRAEELLAREGLPRPRKPERLLGRDYDFPTDPNTLSSMELGRLKLEMASLRAWAQDLMGTRAILLHEMDLVMDLLVPLAMLELLKSEEFKKLPRAGLVKEVVRAAAIDRDDQLKRLVHRSIDVRMEEETFRLRYDIYDGHYAALSREQSRREALSRGGIPE